MDKGDYYATVTRYVPFSRGDENTLRRKNKTGEADDLDA